MILFLLVSLLPLGSPMESAVWPWVRNFSMEGDLILGAIFPFHERNHTQFLFECGRFQVK